jgi:hypothetical protein
MTYSFRYAAAGVLLSMLPMAHGRAAEPVRDTLVAALGWDRDKQSGFAMAGAVDMAGNIWVGTEGNGLWEYDAAKKTWSQFTTKDGLGDNCIYSLAVDQENRVWAGHLNHGVSVYNGKQWRNYGIEDGPLGDHVFAIAVNPKDGNIWMATDLGLARYSDQRQDWDYYTRASGLPSDQIQCLAFDQWGKIYAGTQCNGVAVAKPDDDYQTWHTISAPKVIPAAQWGKGLASDCINMLGIFVIPHVSATIMEVGTPSGLSTTDGRTAGFVHGSDWQDHTPGPYVSAPAIRGILPEEDWMTAFTQVDMDQWVGYRRSGVECIDAKTGTLKITAAVAAPNTVIIRQIIALPDHPPLILANGKTAGGLLTLDATSIWAPSIGGPPPVHGFPLPAPAAVPALDDAKAFAAKLDKLTAQLSPGEAYYLADDWRTEGDWVGRYGSSFVKICAVTPNGDEDYALEPGYDVHIDLGPNHDPSTPAPVSWRNGDLNSGLHTLYSPELGHRRDAENNDWSYDNKLYPESYDGPGLWVHVTVPDGVHCLTLYFVNFDAHDGGGNKYRDYDLKVVPDDPDPAKVQAATPLARARVNDFWGGVYKQFLICGPGKFVVKIGRNRSFVTKVQGVFLDRVTGQPPDNPGLLPGFDVTHYQMPDETPLDAPTPLTKAANDLWNELDQSLGMRGAIPLQIPFHLWCYRAAIASNAPAPLLERWRWEIGLWTDDDRKKFDDAMKAAHAAAQ